VDITGGYFGERCGVRCSLDDCGTLGKFRYRQRIPGGPLSLSLFPSLSIMHWGQYLFREAMEMQAAIVFLFLGGSILLHEVEGESQS